MQSFFLAQSRIPATPAGARQPPRGRKSAPLHSLPGQRSGEGAHSALEQLRADQRTRPRAQPDPEQRHNER